MFISDIDTFIEDYWDGFSRLKPKFLKSFKILEEQLGFYLDSPIPEKYVKDYIRCGGIDPYIDLYDPEFVWEETKGVFLYKEPAILIGESNSYYHFFSLSYDFYFTVLKDLHSIKALHLNLRVMSDYVSPNDDFTDDFTDEEE